MVVAAVAALAIAVMSAHASTFHPFFSDDSFISLRYARRWLQGRGLTWTDGERVEGYSNFLWVVACAALGRLGVDLVTAARALGLVCSSATLAALAYATRPRSWLDAGPALAAALALALAGPFAAWTMAGLETPMVAALLAWTLASWLRWLDSDPPGLGPALAPAVLAALLCLTRPDAPLLIAAIAVGVALARRGRGLSRRPLILFVIVPAAAVLGQLVFRLGYYGDWVPNTAYVKVAFTGGHLLEGARYVGESALWCLPLVAGVVVAAAWARRDAAARARLLPIVVPLCAWVAYVVFIGGDSFLARRNWVPVLVMLALAFGLTMDAVARSGRRVTAWAASALVLGFLAWLQTRDPQSALARSERWEWDGEVVGRFLGEAFGERRPLLAVDPAGCVPYFSDLPALDMLGLNDRHIARTRPAGFGTGMLGHELGDGTYVLERRPDLVLFCNPGGREIPCFPSGKQMALDPRFVAGYVPVQFEGENPHRFRSRIYVNLAGRLGLERDGERIVVPGWLLASNRQSVARLDSSHRVVMEAGADEPAALLGLALEAGRWRLDVEAGDTPVWVRVCPHGETRVLGEGRDPAEFVVDAPGDRAVDLLVWPASGPTASIRAAVLTRVVPASPAGAR